MADRLREARKRAKFEDATSAAERYGWVVPTYLSHENGSRGFKIKTARQYARAFKVATNWLLTGEGEPGRTVPVVGYVGAGAEIYPVDDSAIGSGLDEIEAPPDIGDEAVAVIVRGDSLYPAYRDRDIIVYERYDGPPLDLIGRECVVHLADGRKFVKILQSGSSKNLFTLISYNAPPITDVVVDRAFPVSWIKRR